MLAHEFSTVGIVATSVLEEIAAELPVRLDSGVFGIIVAFAQVVVNSELDDIAEFPPVQQ